MKKIILIWLVFLFSIATTIAQYNLPPVYEIKTDTAVYETLPDSCWQMLEEHSKQLTIEQVGQPPLSNNFHSSNEAKKFDFSVYAYWFRYRLKNETGHDIKISIPCASHYADLYVMDKNKKISHYITGSLVPWSRRDGLKRMQNINVEIKSGQELLCYLRIRSTYVSVNQQAIKIQIGFTENVIRQSYVDNQTDNFNQTIYSLFFGILLLAGMFNLFFFWVVKERVFLFYSLFLLFYAYGIFTNMVPNIVFNEHRLLFFYSNWLSWALYFFFLIHFIRYFIQTYKHSPFWDKILISLSIFQVVCFFSWFFFPIYSIVFYNVLFDLTQIVLMLISDIILVVFILSLRKSKLSGVRLAAVIPPLFFWSFVFSSMEVFSLLSTYLNVPFPRLISLLFQWRALIEVGCIGFMILFFSRILFLRYEDLRRQIAQQALEKEMERSRLIAEQKVELEKTVEERTAELKQSLENLKSTQAQLIQSEKMASLGELTAGIAHEIQNPLNFVNNFSEVNTELIEELQGERSKAKGERNEEQEDEILNDVKQNLEKILHHGKRADAIVKGMLQHSRASTGKKEPTDINALCDEYLRLSYHGMRAKDKSFNATLQTDFDSTIGKINIVSQDIGRVLLNLFNNAFYAVMQKNASTSSAGHQYEPTVSVYTKKIDGKIEIRVKDNGNGIPQKVVDKIFQPFFTTKPTGQGTGLGLSLAYDIIKAHGGEIKVETKEGEGAEFVMILPIKENS